MAKELKLACPKCRVRESNVTTTESKDTEIVRYRQCVHGHRFKTREVVSENLGVTVNSDSDAEI